MDEFLSLSTRSARRDESLYFALFSPAGFSPAFGAAFGAAGSVAGVSPPTVNSTVFRTFPASSAISTFHAPVCAGAIPLELHTRQGDPLTSSFTSATVLSAWIQR